MKSFSQWMEEAYPSERGQEWIDAERRRLLAWPRDRLIGWLMWNDRNGVFSDEDAEREGMDPITVEDAVELVMQHVEENLETPEEMMRSARGPVAGGQYWNRP
jgi:hypothetical protein